MLSSPFYARARLALLLTWASFAFASLATANDEADFLAGQSGSDAVRLLVDHCLACHSGSEAEGKVDFEPITELSESQRREEGVFTEHYKLLKLAADQLRLGTMPPAEEEQLPQSQRSAFGDWLAKCESNVDAQPGFFRPRRLSVVEYRNTMRSLFGFDKELAIMEAEQTLSERSLVVKLLPTDPPGKSGFTNDTRENVLSDNFWDQTTYLTEVYVDELFEPHRRRELAKIVGSEVKDSLTLAQARSLLRNFLPLARRRPVPDLALQKAVASIDGLKDGELESAVKFEMNAAMLSPTFLYRGLLNHRDDSQGASSQQVDAYELAERLSYFLWADMPDAQLLDVAAKGDLDAPEVLHAQIERMLASPKARSLAEDFATQWLTLGEIEYASDNPPIMVALKSQPIDFMHYLFTENRPLIELVDSDVTFINAHTGKKYGSDAKQLPTYRKQRGIEVEIVANHKIQLKECKERGGILTMPGILAMNRGPILRGTWVLERIVGEELPDPPPNVPAIGPRKSDDNLTFRQLFEKHRKHTTCAVCHDRIDPLGFVFEAFDAQGAYLGRKGNRRKSAKNTSIEKADLPDTNGKLPSGEAFSNVMELKQILLTSQKPAVVRNIVEQTLAYALCRELEVYDISTVNQITDKMLQTNGTWRQLFQEIAGSLPFLETRFRKVD